MLWCYSEIQVIAPSGLNIVMLQNAYVVIYGLNYKGGLADNRPGYSIEKRWPDYGHRT